MGRMALPSPSEPGQIPGPATFPVDPTIAARLANLGRLCAASVAVIGLVVLSGWLTGSGALENLGLRTDTVKVNTALALLAAAVCLAGLMTQGRRARRVSAAAALFVLLDGVAHVCEYVLHVHLGIDQALFRDASTVLNPGRMAPNTAVALTLFGLGALLARRRVGRAWPTNALAIAVHTIGIVSLIGDLPGAPSFSGVRTATLMSAPTALACVLLGVGLLVAGPIRGSVGLIASSGPGGALARRLLPVAVVVPALLGLLSHVGETLGLYGSQVGLLLVVLLTVAAVTTLAWVFASDLDRRAAARRSALAELRESESRFRDTFENATVGMALEDERGAIIDANRALCEMLGYAEGELVGMAFPEFTHTDDVERDLAHMDLLLSGEIADYRAEKRYMHADGHVVWAILSVSKARFAEGDPLRFIVQMQDITARKHSEERFAYLAYHDALTDLPNRAMFLHNVELALARAQGHGDAPAPSGSGRRPRGASERGRIPRAARRPQAPRCARAGLGLAGSSPCGLSGHAPAPRGAARALRGGWAGLQAGCQHRGERVPG